MKKSKKEQKSYKIPNSFKVFLKEEELDMYDDYFTTEATKAIRAKMVELFESKLSAAYLKTDKQQNYEHPSWSEYQADAIGYRRALRELISFLK